MRNSFVSFDNTETAFSNKNSADLKRAYWLFKMIDFNWLVKISPPFVNAALALHLPVKGIIRKTIFKHFCGGENIEECKNTVRELGKYYIGSILDYSVEGKEEEKEFDHTLQETLNTIDLAASDKKNIPFSVFKVTGLARFALLEKVNDKKMLTGDEAQEMKRVTDRVNSICQKAFDHKVRVFIDAEESWIQNTIDDLALQMMQRYNTSMPIIYNTYQLYRTDALTNLKRDHALALQNNFILGAKLVRGAYMEKERKRAAQNNVSSPIQPDKNTTDKDYNLALEYCVENIQSIAICAGTHNEASSLLLTDLMEKKSIEHHHSHIFFSQLFGMSDHISFNLAAAGYNVAKYLPYGPVTAVLPYLIRRAQENTSVKGQTGRELGLIEQEKKRRASVNHKK